MYFAKQIQYLPANPSLNRHLAGGTVFANTAGFTGGAIGIGEYEMRPIDQAVGFATFASGGIRRAPYFLAKVTDGEGTVLLENPGSPGEQVIEPRVANDVTYALTDVARSSDLALAGGRDVAAKTGTQGQGENNSDAWMVGFTPSISTAVWMGNDSPIDPIVDVRGRIIYGSGLPGDIWQQFMNTVLEGTPEENLPDAPLIKGDTGEGVPEPTQQPTRPTSSAPSSSAPSTRTSTPARPTAPVEPEEEVTPPADEEEEVTPPADEEEEEEDTPPVDNPVTEEGTVAPTPPGRGNR